MQKYIKATNKTNSFNECCFLMPKSCFSPILGCQKVAFMCQKVALCPVTPY